jgi:hypothetical protein
MHRSDNGEGPSQPAPVENKFSEDTSDTAPPKYQPKPGEGEESLNSTKVKPEGKKRVSPINVLIIGETQNGKSTMIRQLGLYAGMPEIQINIGRGICP